MGHILVVDDEKGMRDFLAIMLQKEGHEVMVADCGEAALEMIRREIFDLVLSDIRMRRISGMEVLREVKACHPDTVVIMITAFASPETAVEAMKEGAYDYISKPFDVESVRITIQRALERRNLKEENLLLKRELKDRAAIDGIEKIVGKSQPMLKVLEMVHKIANSPSNVLITGESGTGKELVARAIHLYSHRRDCAFVPLNCSAIPEGLLESELFGHVKGAFTGAVVNKEGIFEVAHQGTLFLDEIGDISHGMQAKLLRVLQDRTFKRVGGTRDIQVDVRVIAATNQDLKSSVTDGGFREDLFYRLNVLPIHLSPLRERRDDIPLLVDYFVGKYSRILGRNVRGASPEALQMLMEHPWKGNVRELENVIERAIALGTGEIIGTEDIGDSLIQGIHPKLSLPSDIPPEGLDIEFTLGEIEKRLLLKALERTRWVKKEAAKLLRIDFRSLRYRLAKYEIKGRDDRDDGDES